MGGGPPKPPGHTEWIAEAQLKGLKQNQSLDGILWANGRAFLPGPILCHLEFNQMANPPPFRSFPPSLCGKVAWPRDLLYFEMFPVDSCV